VQVETDRLNSSLKEIEETLNRITDNKQLSSTATLKEVIDMINKITGNRKRR